MKLNIARLAVALLFGIQSVPFVATARPVEALSKAKALDQLTEKWGSSTNFGDLFNKLSWRKKQKEELQKALKKDGILKRKLPLLEHSRNNDIVWLSWGEKTSKVLLVSLEPVIVYADYRGFALNREMSPLEFYKEVKNHFAADKRKTVFLFESLQDFVFPTAEAKSKKDGINWAWVGPSIAAMVAGIGAFWYLDSKESSEDSNATSGGSEAPGAQQSSPEQAAPAEPLLKTENKLPPPNAESVAPQQTLESLDAAGEIEKLVKEVQAENALFMTRYACVTPNATNEKVEAILVFEKMNSNPRVRFQLNSAEPNVGTSQVQGGVSCHFRFNEKGEVAHVNTKGETCGAKKDYVPSFSQKPNSKELMEKLRNCCSDLTCKETTNKLLQAELEKYGVVEENPKEGFEGKQLKQNQ